MVDQTTPHPRLWWALAIIALAQFMVIMDTSIIGVPGHRSGDEEVERYQAEEGQNV